MEAKSFKEQLQKVVTSPSFIIATIIVSSIIMGWIGGPGYLLGLFIALLTFWATGWDKSYFGLGKVEWKASVLPALGYTLIIIIFNDIILEPLTEKLLDKEVNLEAFEGLRGNLPNLLIMLLGMWVIAAFGEEFFYRGYVMKRLADLLDNNEQSWVVALILSSLIFGIVHIYQGISGIITTGCIGIILGIALFRNRQNLLIPILTHGLYDTYGLTMIYLGNETVLKDWVMNNIY
ncbi:MAG: type II CAAX endopeptidase family protein [Fulvivirga sp.]|nr:type II CAAX endopeptidase family protein [Fulvivirga sp.]